jgi:hypothetical protein
MLAPWPCKRVQVIVQLFTYVLASRIHSVATGPGSTSAHKMIKARQAVLAQTLCKPACLLAALVSSGVAVATK